MEIEREREEERVSMANTKAKEPKALKEAEKALREEYRVWLCY